MSESECVCVFFWWRFLLPVHRVLFNYCLCVISTVFDYLFHLCVQIKCFKLSIIYDAIDTSFFFLLPSSQWLWAPFCACSVFLSLLHCFSVWLWSWHIDHIAFMHSIMCALSVCSFNCNLFILVFCSMHRICHINVIQLQCRANGNLYSCDARYEWTHQNGWNMADVDRHGI